LASEGLDNGDLEPRQEIRGHRGIPGERKREQLDREKKSENPDFDVKEDDMVISASRIVTPDFHEDSRSTAPAIKKCYF